MSQENVEIVREMYAAFHGSDADKAISYFSPAVLVDASKARPDFPVGRGREHVIRLVASWIAAWEGWREEIQEMRDLETRVLVLSVQRGRGKESGAEVETPYAVLYGVEDGEITSLRMYGNAAEALEAAGLSD
jgi:ketosteroid isomerase-like protein